MLESIRDIFNTAHIRFESINFIAEEINSPSDMIHCIENEKKTPVVAVCNSQFCQTTGKWIPNFNHAMIATGIKSERRLICLKRHYLQCKNSYRDDPNQSGTFQIF